MLVPLSGSCCARVGLRSVPKAAKERSKTMNSLLEDGRFCDVVGAWRCMLLTEKWLPVASAQLNGKEDCRHANDKVNRRQTMQERKERLEKGTFGSTPWHATIYFTARWMINPLQSGVGTFSNFSARVRHWTSAGKWKEKGVICKWIKKLMTKAQNSDNRLPDDVNGKWRWQNERYTKGKFKRLRNEEECNLPSRKEMIHVIGQFLMSLSTFKGGTKVTWTNDVKRACVNQIAYYKE